VGTQQHDNETVLAYTQRFLSARDTYVALAGSPTTAENMVCQHPEYDRTDGNKISQCRADVAERLMTFLNNKNSDMSRFGSFIEDL
jgi:hypothetical protein